ncbi:hypothetical protein WPS_15680 [Vulcanimicrobium alpinum]|uniref:Acyltransferase 3 domain-containing protein n=1 Tax=Vulcanimicrobium alpinum TaxID=3016050 RepID=A0AAN1XXY3_UNVUL|nr:acyltransferase [Vulcanimicrobium alpinum]BDE06292.1 hypothetical protein WPS_15680 [Vulcanimicrobium alpinum]
MSGQAKNSEAVHLDHVDGLRAIAVLGVVLYHGVVHSTWPLYVQGLAASGSHGVELFFVISGLCLAFPFLRSYHRSGDLGFTASAFFAKRAVRILPPYYVVLVLFGLAALTALWRAAAAREPQGMTPHLTLPSFAAHFVFAARMEQLLDASFWTLRVEAIWYLLFPLALLAYVRARRVFWLVAAACPLAVLLNLRIPGFGTSLTMLVALPAFLLGIVAADWLLRRRTAPAWLIGLGVVAAVVAAVWEFRHPDIDNVRVRILWDFAAFAFVVLVSRSPAIRSAISTRAAIAVGVASYSIYLIHEPVVVIAEYLHVPPPLACVVGVAFGFALWWLVERTFTSDRVRRPMVAFVERMFSRAAGWRAVRGAPAPAPAAAVEAPQ